MSLPSMRESARMPSDLLRQGSTLTRRCFAILTREKLKPKPANIVEIHETHCHDSGGLLMENLASYAAFESGAIVPFSS